VKILVTGGSGFIGSHVVDRLLAHGHEPRIFDLVSSRHHDPDEVDTVIGDLLDLDALLTAVEGCEAIIHLAASADVDAVLANPSRAVLNNGYGTSNVLEAARLQGIDRVIYASTVWVYGDTNGNGLVDEDTPLPQPNHVYTATKLAGEMYCAAYGELYGFGHTILRFGIPYGPRARPTTVLAALVAKALAGEPLTIAGDGLQSRRFIYVEDLADGVVAALAPLAAGRVYNLAGVEATSVLDIANIVRELVADVPLVHGPGRPSDVRGAALMSIVRADNELDWRPSTAFAEGVRRYIEWLTPTNGSPVAAMAASTNGNAATVVRHEPSQL